MNKFLSLMKITLIDQFNLNKLFKKDKLISKIFVLLLIILVYALVGFYFGMVFYGIGTMLVEVSGPEPILTVGILMSSLILIITTMTKANAYLFRAKDFELLSSLSIPLSTIVLTKISSFLIFSYVSLAILYIPLLVTYAMLATTTFIFWVIAIIGFFILPLLIISIFSVVSYLLSLVVSKFKYKNAISIIFSLLAFVAIMVFSFTFTNFDETTDFNNLLISINNSLKYIYYPGYLLKEALLGSNLNILWFILLGLVPFIIFVFYTSKVYVYVNSKLKHNRVSTKFNDKMISKNKSGSFMSLLKLEFKKFFSIPLYVMNSLTGSLLIVVMSFSIIFTGGVDSIISEVGPTVVMAIILALILFMGGMTATTTSTISLEGKSLWILKSLPVSETKIFWSKILVDASFTFIAALIVTIMGAILVNAPILITILIIVASLIYALFKAILGLLINLKFYRLDWDLPVKVIKQGLSVFVMMVVGILSATLIVFFAYFLLVKVNLSIDLVILLITTLYLIFLVVELFILIKLAPKWFREIKN